MPESILDSLWSFISPKEAEAQVAGRATRGVGGRSVGYEPQQRWYPWLQCVSRHQGGARATGA